MHRVVNIGVIAFSMLTFAHVGKVTAQSSYATLLNDSIDEDHYLDEVIVTTSQIAIPINQSAKQILIISKEDFKSTAIQSVQDLLNYSSSIDVQQRGVHGVQADISMRGGSSDQTAILLNGINLSNPQTGHYSFDIPVNLSDIDHIEILNGPSSLGYGVNAFSGGINIITKKKVDEKLFVKTQYGEHNLINLEASSSIQLQNYTNRISANYSKSDGYINNSDYNLFNVLWQGNLNIDQSKKIEALVGFNNKKYGANTFYSPSYPDQYDKTRSYFATIKGEIGDVLKFIPSLYWNRHHDEFQLFRDGTVNTPQWYKGHNYHQSDVYGLDLKVQYRSKYGISSMRSEFRNEGIVSNVLGTEMDYPKGKYTKTDNRTNISYVLEHSVLFNRFTFTAGILANYNTQSQDNFKLYPSINASYWITDEMKVYSSWNKATRLPTFTDLYYSSVTHVGNKNLKPENSESIEFGINYKVKFIDSYISSYWMKGTNLIDWIKNTPDEPWKAENLTRINKFGVDIGTTIFFETISPIFKQTYLNIGYTRLNQTKESDLISNKTLNYLRDKLTAQLNHKIYKDLSMRWSFRWQKRMGGYLKYENLKPTTEVDYPAFSTLDVRFNYKLKSFNFTLDLNNIFDTHYYDLGNIPQPGFWLIGGLSYTLK